ncbi:hypothetical protein A8709_26665 [Paenibacillus pectinilyticus]|uniref:TniQ family protein n=1 Tax=Paenibacillus pectinilyticus TaxID=512399 RepID=A0A1C1A1I9_9BACL|nr:hypothetical protein [Paenibacillus pectinilyticus]OCT14395.1 hypothetical protein A8709_26665 [Paenibacillus pectinilyticus]
MEKYNWRTEWIRPFESTWSILEKLCYSNVIIRRGPLLKHLGNDKVKTMKGPVKAQRHNNLLTMFGFDEVSLSNSLGVNIIKQNKETINQLLNNVTRISTDLNDWFNEDLIWCEQCIEDGYHSVLHQFKLLKHCPFHMKKLIYTCSNCNSIPYQFSDTALAAAFTCKCRFQFADLKKRWFNWGNKFEIQCEITLKWLSTNFNSLNQSILFLPEYAAAQMNPIKKIVELLEDTDSHISYGGNGQSSINHQKVPLTISKFSIDNKECFHDYFIDLDFNLASKSANMPLYKYMYKQSVNVFKSIEHHLLYGELTKHKTCIQRFRELRKVEKGDYPEICPYAYSYVFCKHSFMGDKFFSVMILLLILQKHFVGLNCYRVSLTPTWKI